MAFSDLKPVSVSDDDGGRTYIIGSVFAVYGVGSEPPLVYSWNMVRQVTVTRKGFTVETAGKSFSFANKSFGDIEEVLRAIAIIECRQKEYGFGYQHEKRMFPLKSQYMECSPGKETYIGEGMLDDGETAAAFIMLLNFKLVKFLWLVALLIMFVTLGILHIMIGITRDNILYFLPISLAAGGIASLLVHIITHAVARAKFKRLADADPATRQPITFVVSRAGFAACESCTYESRDLVPWSELDYFIESDKMFILYKNNAAVAYIPKKAFEKKFVGGIADIIALSLEQR
ncbi:MAG: YcxB family protein [Lachnospiraceae bacterium]|nr:YcxB family protein [Ruminococcus sp.]MCM1274499.1 YcxB family protein [Lachnospiraceae bacterium]